MNQTSYQLPKLPYEYDALEPVISEKTLKLHHTKHHQAYVDNLNKALDEYHQAESTNDMEKMLSLEGTISFNGGGHVNHSLFWETLTPASKSGKPSSTFVKAIEKDFGSFEAFKEKFVAKATAVQGSGWAWLGYDKGRDVLAIITTQNHYTIKGKGFTPVLIVDVWEHAYYLDYQNKRKDFIGALFGIFHWEKISQRYESAKK